LARLRQAFRADVRICPGVGPDQSIGHAPNFTREDFDRWRLDGGNKSTAKQRRDEWRVAIFAALSTPVEAGTMFFFCALLRETIVSAGAEGNCDMRQLRSLLRAAPSRIRRRLALIVAIAAASLPAAGA
jgi:hypothetical protein